MALYAWLCVLGECMELREAHLGVHRPVSTVRAVLWEAMARRITDDWWTVETVSPLDDLLHALYACQRCHGRRCPTSIAFTGGCAFAEGHGSDCLSAGEVSGYRTACSECGFDPMAVANA